MVGIFCDDRGTEMVDGIRASLVLVGQPFLQAVNVTTATRKGQVTEHVVERAILQHQNDDVVNLRKVGRTGLLHHNTPVVVSYPSVAVPMRKVSARVGCKPGCLRIQDVPGGGVHHKSGEVHFIRGGLAPGRHPLSATVLTASPVVRLRGSM